MINLDPRPRHGAVIDKLAFWLVIILAGCIIAAFFIP